MSAAGQGRSLGPLVLRSRGVKPAQAALLVERSIKFLVARGGFSESGDGADAILLRLPLDSARLPKRGDPWVALPHSRNPFGLVQPPVDIVEVVRLGKRYRGRRSKRHRTGLAGAMPEQAVAT